MIIPGLEQIREWEAELIRAFKAEGIEKYYLRLEYEDYTSGGKLWFSITEGWYVRRKKEVAGAKIVETALIPSEYVVHMAALLYFMAIEDEAIARSKGEPILCEKLGIRCGTDLNALSADEWVDLARNNTEALEQYLRDTSYVIKREPGLMDTEWSIVYLLRRAYVNLTLYSR